MMPLFNKRLLYIIFIITLIVSLVGSSLYVPQAAYADELNLPPMPKPGVMVHLSPDFTPALLKGIVIHPENAFNFDFIVYKGDKEFTDSQKKKEYTKLIKYFLASLAVPDEDQWVNLSPYEKSRIIKDDFGKTEMGRDLLAQDYLLKQITASLIYPQDKLGRKFWDEVYSRAYKKFGTSNIPVNTFNKVWIVPDDADIYEKGNTAYLYKSHLKVMLEEDYLAISQHRSQPGDMFPAKRGTCPQAGCQAKQGLNTKAPHNNPHALASQIVREIVLPQLEKEVNEGKNFAPLRQVFSGMILAAWYKRALRESLLARIYANKAKVKGVDQDPKNNEAIYQQYLKAYKKGVFNYIKEDVDKYTNETIPRKYFSGGAGLGADAAMLDPVTHEPVLSYLHENPPNAGKATADSLFQDNAQATYDLAAVSVDPKQAKQSAADAERINELRDQAMFINNLPASVKIKMGKVIDDFLKGDHGGKPDRAMIINMSDVLSALKKISPEEIESLVEQSVISEDQKNEIILFLKRIRDLSKEQEGKALGSLVMAMDNNDALNRVVNNLMGVIVGGEPAQSVSVSNAAYRSHFNRLITYKGLGLLVALFVLNRLTSTKNFDSHGYIGALMLFTAIGLGAFIGRDLGKRLDNPYFYHKILNSKDIRQMALDFLSDREKGFIVNGGSVEIAASKLRDELRAWLDKAKWVHDEKELKTVSDEVLKLFRLEPQERGSYRVWLPRRDTAMTAIGAIAVTVAVLAVAGVLYRLIKKPRSEDYMYRSMVGEFDFYWSTSQYLTQDDFEKYVPLLEEWHNLNRYGWGYLSGAFSRVLTRPQIEFLAKRKEELKMAQSVLARVSSNERLNRRFPDLATSRQRAAGHLYYMMINKILYLEATNQFLGRRDFEIDISLLTSWYASLEEFQQEELVEEFSRILTAKQVGSLRNVKPPMAFTSRLLQAADAEEHFKSGGDVVGFHGLPVSQTEEGTAKAIEAGLIPELGGPWAMSIARQFRPWHILAQTVHSGGLVEAVRAGADILIASEMLNKDEIDEARQQAGIKNQIIVIAGIDTAQHNAEEQIAIAAANGANGVKFKPAGRGNEENTARLIEFTKIHYPNFLIMVAGGINSSNRHNFGEGIKAGIGADTLSDIPLIAKWARISIDNPDAAMGSFRDSRVSDPESQQTLGYATEIAWEKGLDTNLGSVRDFTYRLFNDDRWKNEAPLVKALLALTTELGWHGTMNAHLDSVTRFTHDLFNDGRWRSEAHVVRALLALTTALGWYGTMNTNPDLVKYSTNSLFNDKGWRNLNAFSRAVLSLEIKLRWRKSAYIQWGLDYFKDQVQAEYRDRNLTSQRLMPELSSLKEFVLSNRAMISKDIKSHVVKFVKSNKRLVVSAGILAFLTPFILYHPNAQPTQKEIDGVVILSIPAKAIPFQFGDLVIAQVGEYTMYTFTINTSYYSEKNEDPVSFLEHQRLSIRGQVPVDALIKVINERPDDVTVDKDDDGNDTLEIFLEKNPSPIPSAEPENVPKRVAKLESPGGIDLNAANLNLHIKRDGNGVPLPVSQQDLDDIHIDGLVPVILGISPASASPVLSQLTAA